VSDSEFVHTAPDEEDGGWIAWTEGHPGCVGQGETEADAITDMRGAIAAADRLDQDPVVAVVDAAQELMLYVDSAHTVWGEGLRAVAEVVELRAALAALADTPPLREACPLCGGKGCSECEGRGWQINPTYSGPTELERQYAKLHAAFLDVRGERDRLRAEADARSEGAKGDA
jgi:hypothetical protein